MAQSLALPLAITSSGSLATLPQDSPAEIAQSVGLLAATRPGERRSVPGYGTPDPLGGGIDVDQLAEAVAEWEERADPASIELVTDGPTIQHVSVAPALLDDEEDEEA